MQSASRIRVLDDALADQIAAGEVVERPASVVKELLENALDAGARTVRVEIRAGGIEDIRVSDDGSGMGPADAALAVRRHATSKIATREDLAAITTLGFRGEALPSIASVSRFELSTREASAVAGTRIAIEGGAAPEISEVGCAPGTTVRVHDLFYNVPARRKFLKAKGTESAQVADVCRRAALAHPELRLSLHRDGRRSFELLPAPDLRARAASVFTKERLSAVEGEREGLRLEAMLGAPERARAGAGGLHLFVNRRPVKDRALARAIAFAYGSVLPPGRYPVGVVHIEIDPREVDVNVHPQKAEVRFAGGRRILDLLTRILAAGLGTTAWSGRLPKGPNPLVGGPTERGPSFWQERLNPAGAAPEAEAPDPWDLAGTRSGPSSVAEGRSSLERASVQGRWEQEEAPMPRAVVDEATPLLEPVGFFGSLRVLGQVRRMFIVCEGPDGLHIIDQHAADERVRFDLLRRAHRAQKVKAQRLLVPERVEVDEADVALVEENGALFAAVGLDVSPLGDRTLAVHEVPVLVRRAAPEALLRDLLTELGREGERAFGDRVDMAMATMACHGAIRGGDALSLEECRALLKAMDAVEDFGGHCPHGRPVVHSLGFDELERRLLR